MMCFRDRTYCKFYKECAEPCGRALTPEIIGKAKECGLLICQFSGRPGCFKEKKK